MKYFIDKSSTAKSGIMVVAVADDGTEAFEDLNKRTSDGYVYLPDYVVSATNRRMFCIKRALEATGRYALTQVAFKEARVLNNNPARNKPLEDFLEGEERELFLKLKAKAEKAKEEAINHVPTELEKAQAALAKAQALVAKLTAQANNA